AGEILPQLASPKVLEGFDADGKPRLRPARRPLTVRHLLTHTSGYTYANWSEALTRYERVTGLPDIATLRNDAFNAPLEFDPGTRWEYGIGMDWVGKLIEQVTDQSLEVYFRERIFQPLGMKDSGFLISSEQKRRVATLFNRQPEGSLVAAPFEMPQRGRRVLGGSAQLLFLARPGEEGHRCAVHPNPALLRRSRGLALWQVRTRTLSRPRAHLTSR